MNSAPINFEHMQTVLRDLESSIENNQKLLLSIRELNPGFEQVSEAACEKRSACSWLYGATEVLERNEVEKWLYPSVSLSETAKGSAGDHYEKWQEHILENGEYLEFKDADLVCPKEGERLYEFIWRLAANLEEHGWGKKKNKRALKCFLSFLRENNSSQEMAFLEHNFPEKMDINCDNSIYRLIRPQVYPIPEEIAGDIVKTLVNAVVRGRANARLKNAEALAFCWLCLTASRLRLPTTEENIHAISADAIFFEGDNAKFLHERGFCGSAYSPSRRGEWRL